MGALVGIDDSILNAAPEVFHCKDINGKSDLWNLGCIIFEMAELEKPFPPAGSIFLHAKNVMDGAIVDFDKASPKVK